MRTKILLTSIGFMAILLGTTTSAFGQQAPLKTFSIITEDESLEYPVKNSEQAAGIFKNYLLSNNLPQLNGTENVEGGWFSIVTALAPVVIDAIDKLAGGAAAAASTAGVTQPANETIASLNEAGIGDWFNKIIDKTTVNGCIDWTWGKQVKLCLGQPST